MEQLVIESKLSEMDKIRDYLNKNLHGLNISEEDQFSIELSLLEICTNIVRYAYLEKTDKIFIKSWIEGDRFFLEIKDNGIPFDPTAVDKPDLQKILKSEQIGGFGILISRQFMDGFEYRRKNDQNVLVMYKKISS